MIKAVYIDTGVLGLLTHPKANAEAIECTQWLINMLKQGVRFCLPEICDYELRREYVLNERGKALAKLDDLKNVVEFVAIESDMMLKASELWAYARKINKPTADKHALDGDVILSAQALTKDQKGNVHVATTNVGHLSLFLKADEWRNINIDN